MDDETTIKNIFECILLFMELGTSIIFIQTVIIISLVVSHGHAVEHYTALGW